VLRSRYGHKINRTNRWEESKEQSKKGKDRNWAMTCTAEESTEALFEEPTVILDKMYNPMALPAVIGDTMYLHQDMKQPSQDQFLKAVMKEIETHQKRKNWEVTPVEQVPKGTVILDSIWAMRRKSE